MITRWKLRSVTAWCETTQDYLKTSENDDTHTLADVLANGADANDLDITSESESTILQNDILAKKDVFTKSLESITKLNDDIDNAMTTISDSIDTSVVDILINPSGIADQIITLANTPSNIATTAIAQIEGYGSVIDIIIGSGVDTINEYNNSLLFASASFGALSLSMLNSEFSNRPEAIEALEKLADIYDNISEWMDDNITDFEIQDTGEIYTSMNQVYSKISGYLVRLSFELPKEIHLTLTEDRNIIELTSELYNNLDMLDFFIQTNNLTTDEIELLPLGKEVIYYE